MNETLKEYYREEGRLDAKANYTLKPREAFENQEAFKLYREGYQEKITEEAIYW